MRLKFLIIPSLLICQVAGAQTGTVSVTSNQGTASTPLLEPTPVPEVPPPAPPTPAEAVITSNSILDYKSVYEAATVEEEVKMATERFSLTPAQQEMWLSAAADRRVTERQVQEKLDSKADFDRNGVYRGLRTAHNTFHETVISYLNPTQKEALESDRQILQEKQQKLAKLPPPPPPAPTVTVAPVDSAAIKEQEKAKSKSKKAKKKKKQVSQ